MSANEFWKVMNENFAQIVQLYNTAVDDISCCETEFFKKLLDKEFDVNYKVPDIYIFEKDWLVGCTIFHLLRSVGPDLCQNLIDRGADYTTKDKRGSTVLLREASSNYEKYLDSLELEDVHDLKQELCGNVILSAQVNSQNSKNPKDKNGLSHFHVACMYNQADAAKFFLENGVSVNESVNRDSTFYPGYSALHFAAKSSAFETVKLLLSNGADMLAKDSKDMSPLHLLIVDRWETFVRLQRLSRISSSNKKKSKYSNLCNYYTKNEKIIYLLLDIMKEHNCYLDNDTGLSYFHVLCFLGNMSMIQTFLDYDKEKLSQSVCNNSPIWPGYKPLHIAAHSNVETVELLMQKGADLTTKDANGVTPFDICLSEFTVKDVHRILLLQPDLSNIVFSDGKTKLCDFVHAMQDTVTFENFLKDNLIDPNVYVPFDSPICAGYSPLHLAIISAEKPMSWTSKNCDSDILLFRNMENEKFQTYLSRIDSCLHYNPDITSKDAKGSTPLHWAFRLRQSKAVDHLLEQCEINSNPADEHGLSLLHIACAAGKETVVERLLSKGANINDVATASYIWKEVDTKTYFRLNTVQYFINKGSTPLHFAASTRCSKTVEILINNGADVLARDADNLIALERLLQTPIFQDSVSHKRPRCVGDNINEVITLLIEKTGDQLVDAKPRQMLYCYSLLEDNLLLKILSEGDESTMKILASVGITELHVACCTGNSDRVSELIDKADVNARVNLDSPIWPGCTALHVLIACTPGYIHDDVPLNVAILDKLLENGADVAASNAKGETPIHLIFRFQRYSEGVIKLLEHLEDFSVNPTSARGYTHLHVASACGHVSTVEKLLEQGALIDQPTDYFLGSLYAGDHAGCNALHFAAARQQKDVVDVLLKYGADVNQRNAHGGNPLHAAMNVYHQQRNFEMLQTLMGARADIHAKDMNGWTPFEVLIQTGNATIEEVALFLVHGSRVNTVNPISDDGFLAIALKQSQELPIFEMLVKVLDVKDIDHNGRNAIHNVVSCFHFKRRVWQEFARRDINEGFTPPDEYIRGIDILIKLGLNINHQDCKGSTPLHSAAQMQNYSGIVGLLENGADINIVDTNGKTAFDYSFQLAMLHHETKEVDLHIQDIIWMHMYKLHVSSIEISSSNKEVHRAISCNRIPACLSQLTECCDEIERMEEQKISSTSVTFYEFLSDTGAVSAFPYMLPCVQTAIGSYFKDETKSLRAKFPLWTGVLLLQYQKALARGDMITQAETSLNILVGFDMPVLCSRQLFRFLSNDELNNLINSTNN